MSDPSDRFERDAAANADRAMATPTPATPAMAGVQRFAESGASDTVQREGAPEEEEEPTAQGMFVQREGEEEEEATE